MKENVLVTGSRGFIGRHLTPKLRELGYNVYEANSNNTPLLGEFTLYGEFRNVKFDYIFHLAVKTKAGGYCQKHQGEQFLLNQIMNTNILKFWYEHAKDAKFITFGTSSGYDENMEKIEENYTKGGLESGYEVYAMIKQMLLTGLKAFNAEYGMKYVYLIPSTVYGPNYDLDDKHFIFDIIRKICDAKYKGIEPVVLWGTGLQRRDLIYIDDCVNIIIDSMNKENEIINLVSGKDHSMIEYAKEICSIIDYDFNKIDFDVNQFVGAQSKRMENTKNKDFKFTNLRIGLSKTIDYYKAKNYEQGE